MAVTDRTKLFHYKTGSTFLHRIPAGIKILIIPILAAGAFQLSLLPALAAWLCVIILELFLKFTPREILRDSKPAFLYFIFLYISSLTINIMEFSSSGMEFNFNVLIHILKFDHGYPLLFARMGLSLAFTSVIYRTTSSIQFRQGFSKIENFIRPSGNSGVSNMIGITLTFIPRISIYWNQLDTAWKARNGRNSLKKIIRLTPRLFSVSMKDAYEKARAIENRRP